MHFYEGDHFRIRFEVSLNNLYSFLIFFLNIVQWKRKLQMVFDGLQGINQSK
jgi:hypothetical protein